MAVTPAQRLRELLAQPNVEIMPGCYDALSAKLVADALTALMIDVTTKGLAPATDD